ncbi:MAG: putative lipid II flippase FtsW [Candidatus Pacebacteria bacterium]|nr:putative lipid II flippase FtsW [Candidatus Paceibacterota bacterium]
MKSHEIDKTLLLIVGLLSSIGLVAISSAGVVMSYNKFGYNHYYLLHQFMYGFLPGIIALLILQKIDYRIFKKNMLLFLIITIILLFVVFIPGLGLGLKGANRWISIAGISFQPSEFIKLTFILYIAVWFEKNKKDFSNLLIPFIVLIFVISIPLIKQPDVGTLSIIILTAAIMYFAYGAKIKNILLLGVGGLAGLLFLIKIAPYRMDRFMVFLHPEIDPQGIGYQINQALLAFGSGGLFGLGFGQSRQKFNYLPEPIGDSIFAIIGEEFGLFGLCVIVVLFLFFALRGYKIASNAPDDFGKLVAIGITSLITFQAIINMAAITSLLPLTGIPLPFISYGGSNLIVSLAAVGILLNISKHSKAR